MHEKLRDTKKVPQKTSATKILPNFWVNFLVRFASEPLFYWVVPSTCSEKSLVLFVRFFGFGVRFWLLKMSKNILTLLDFFWLGPFPLAPSVVRWFWPENFGSLALEGRKGGFVKLRIFLENFHVSTHLLGARLRGRTGTQHSKKGSGKGSGEGFWGRVGPTMGFTVKRVLQWP